MATELAKGCRWRVGGGGATGEGKGLAKDARESWTPFCFLFSLVLFFFFESPHTHTHKKKK